MTGSAIAAPTNDVHGDRVGCCGPAEHSAPTSTWRYARTFYSDPDVVQGAADGWLHPILWKAPP